MSSNNRILAELLRSNGIEGFVPEYRFDKERRWRFDLAFPEHKLAVEIEGGIWISGRHTRAMGYEGDCEKYNAATLQGWRVLRFPTTVLQREPKKIVAAVKNGLAKKIILPSVRSLEDEVNIVAQSLLTVLHNAREVLKRVQAEVRRAKSKKTLRDALADALDMMRCAELWVSDLREAVQLGSCDKCGKKISKRRIVLMQGKRLCGPCAEEELGTLRGCKL